MSKNRIRRKHVADATQLRRRSHPASPTYKEGPPGSANRCSTHNANKERHKGPPVSLLEEDKDEGHWGVGRTLGLAEPALPPIQVHLEEELPRHLITFHMCVGGKPTSTSINRPLLHPPQDTHTHTHFIPPFQESSPLSCSLS